MTTLGVDARVRRGTADLVVDLEAADEVVALTGPNGAGKSTILHLVAGLVRCRDGSVTVDGTIVDDGGRRYVPPEARPVATAFQDDRLLPHLDAVDNVAFPLRCAGHSRTVATRAAHDLLDRVGASHVAEANPATLSGGEQRRVALARALARPARVLLLDEPLSGIDVEGRAALRRLLRAEVGDVAGVRIVVSHDPVDLALLADRTLRVEGGRLVPVAGRGENVLTGAADGNTVAVAGSTLVAATRATGPVVVVVPPPAVALHAHRPDGSPRNVWSTVVTGIEPAEDRVRVRLGPPLGLVAEVTPAAATALALDCGTAVWASVKATEIEVHES